MHGLLLAFHYRLFRKENQEIYTVKHYSPHVIRKRRLHYQAPNPQPQRKRKGDFGIGHHKNPPLQRKRKRSMGRAGGPETSS